MVHRSCRPASRKYFQTHRLREPSPFEVGKLEIKNVSFSFSFRSSRHRHKNYLTMLPSQLVVSWSLVIIICNHSFSFLIVSRSVQNSTIVRNSQRSGQLFNARWSLQAIDRSPYALCYCTIQIFWESL